eukprot:COSAG01_NODE_404_length_17467_cov_69.758650_2_plen_129_part_00
MLDQCAVCLCTQSTQYAVLSTGLARAVVLLYSPLCLLVLVHVRAVAHMQSVAGRILVRLYQSRRRNGPKRAKNGDSAINTGQPKSKSIPGTRQNTECAPVSRMKILLQPVTSFQAFSEGKLPNYLIGQ